MSTVWSDGHFIAGDVALDFANTVYRRWPVPGADLLDDPEALRTWLARADLLPRTGGAAGDTTLREARALRSWCWTVLDAQRDGLPLPSDALAGLLDAARHGAGDVSVHLDGSARASTVDGALSVIALRAVTLVLHPPPQRVRACDRCGWFFIDTSRGRRRRWCSMQTCGNQAKAKRHRSTH